MKEEIIQLSEHLKGLTDGERTILWQAMTVDILSRLMKRDEETIHLLFGKFEDGLFHAEVCRQSARGEIEKALMTFAGERAATQ